MPLKPIFDKAPLTMMTTQPLSAGMVRSENAMLKQVYEICRQDDAVASLEGVFRLACLVSAHPDAEPVTACIRVLLDTQRPDGSFDLSPANAVALLRACWAMYEYEARKPLLEYVARWCAWASQNWATVMADDDVWSNPAELLELLENLYRVTGMGAVLSLCERINVQAMQWGPVLNTVAVQPPTMHTMPREELDTCLAIEEGSREGYYTRFCRVNHAARLADGARASMARGWFSGSATELNAAQNGWERLTRSHGAICGCLTSDELLEGKSPAMAVSTEAVGAWAEALCSAVRGRHAGWAWEALEILSCNAAPACVFNGKILPFQRVNSLNAEATAENCFRILPDHDCRAKDRFVRGCAAMASSAVSALTDGFMVGLYLPGRYAVPVGDSLMVVDMTEKNGVNSICIHCRQETRAVVRLRVPAWAKKAEITVNGMESDAGKECGAWNMRIDRTWHDGDVITVHLEKSLRVLEGHHQGRYVMKGPQLMALPADGKSDWAFCLIGCSQADDRVMASLDKVNGWRTHGDVPADIPVLPAASGEELQSRELVPYAAAPARIAMFPGRKNA